jgi:hypothetical protein
MTTLPPTRPDLPGWNTTLMVQDIPAATLEPQVLVWENCTLAVMLVMFKVVLPVLVSVTCWGALAPPIRAPNLRLTGSSFTWPAVIVMVATADLVVSSTGIALSATAGLVGTVAGGV